ncbi:ankyrin repeat domain-containing protein [Acrocarpospora catenulata]|uniref:ankyrin repeat domain-containing protein n=1 Tax=Acrocarpospora catenulata TaxID=2836182 RepID=UPI001BD9FEBF|nr:ankyrin repeat domain-containing protein [Acrocarpospora catenulata]
MTLSCPPEEAASWQRIRQYAVPRSMIEQATAHRLAGDWQGACAAANVDVTFTLSELAQAYGREFADAIEDDLHAFTPDLLRWHLPRVRHGYSTIEPGQVIILSSPLPGGLSLHLTAPVFPDGPQRLTLRVGEISPRLRSPHRRHNVQDWSVARHLWDAWHSADLLERCGGGDRPPFFNADGSPRAVPATPPTGDDPAAHTEWVTTLHERGEIEAALAAADIEFETTGPDMRCWESNPFRVLDWIPLALTRLGPETQRLGGRCYLRYRYTSLMLERHEDTGRLRVKLIRDHDIGDLPLLATACWRRLPDLDLLHHGRTVPERLHPLVRDALFPRHPAGPAGPPDPEPPAPVRVRCRGEWHEVRATGSTLHLPHTEVEQQRERAMRAFGGAVAGCFAVQQAWTSGTGWLPKALRAQRNDFFLRVQHGDTPGVLRLLDAGMSPHLQDGRRRNLLHSLHLLDHERLLSRLLAAGVDLEAQDHFGRTPLHVAVGDYGSTALVRALLDAGARIDVVDDGGWSLGDGWAA